MEKDIYIWSRDKIQELMNRKKHIETKILYLLPVITIVMALITINIKAQVPKEIEILSKWVDSIAYVLLILCLLILINGLKDTLLSKKWVRILMDYEYGEKIFIQEGILDSPYPKRMLDGYNSLINEKKEEKEIYGVMIEGLDNVCKEINYVAMAKNMCFEYGVKIITIVVTMVLIKNIIIIN